MSTVVVGIFDMLYEIILQMTLVFFHDLPALLKNSDILELVLDCFENNLNDVPTSLNSGAFFLLFLFPVHFFVYKINLSIFIDLIENLAAVHDFFEVANFKAQVLNIVEGPVFVISNGLHHEFSARKKITFQIELHVDGDEPEINDIWVKLNGLGKYAI